MERVTQIPGTDRVDTYRARVAANRPMAHYTPRIVAHRAGVRVPLEIPFILWQR